MPVLRFTRDPRGYESTYLVESPRRGAEGQTLLYWFRTPPHVKVGRAAFDEEAIRLLEQQHPDIDFDWDRILSARPPAAPEPRESRHYRPERRQVRSRPPAAPEPPSLAAPAPSSEPAAPPPLPEPAVAASAEPMLATPVVSPISPPEETAAPARRFVRVYDDQPAADERPAADEPPAEGEPHRLTEPSAAERLLGPEQLTILRARYAEIQARISARGGDPARIDALREQAERINPDAWVTEDEVAKGFASVDDICAELHRAVGRKRRRRRRGGRGGRRQETSATTAVEGAPEADATGEPEPPDTADEEDDEPGLEE